MKQHKYVGKNRVYIIARSKQEAYDYMNEKHINFMASTGKIVQRNVVTKEKVYDFRWR